MYMYSVRYSFSIERVLAKLSSASSQSGQVHPACSSLVDLNIKVSVSVPYLTSTSHNRQNIFLSS